MCFCASHRGISVCRHALVVHQGGARGGAVLCDERSCAPHKVMMPPQDMPWLACMRRFALDPIAPIAACVHVCVRVSTCGLSALPIASGLPHRSLSCPESPLFRGPFVQLAERMLLAAHQLCPADAATCHELGVLNYRNGQHEAAASWLHAALNLVPTELSKQQGPHGAPLFGTVPEIVKHGGLLSSAWEPTLLALGHCLRKQWRWAEALQVRAAAACVRAKWHVGKAWQVRDRSGAAACTSTGGRWRQKPCRPGCAAT